MSVVEDSMSGVATARCHRSAGVGSQITFGKTTLETSTLHRITQFFVGKVANYEFPAFGQVVSESAYRFAAGRICGIQNIVRNLETVGRNVSDSRTNYVRVIPYFLIRLRIVPSETSRIQAVRERFQFVSSRTRLSCSHLVTESSLSARLIILLRSPRDFKTSSLTMAFNSRTLPG